MITNKADGEQVLLQIDCLIDKAAELKQAVNKFILGNKSKTLILEMLEILKLILSICEKMQREVPFSNAAACCRNIIFSLNQLLQSEMNKNSRLMKVEFEVIPFLEDFKYDVYFFSYVYGNKEKEREHYKSEFALMTANHYIEQAAKENTYKYEVSIVVTAYNKLEYTKRCMEHIHKYMPEHLSYELILINNGSTDGTQAYFEALKPNKLMTLKENIPNSYMGLKARICEGRYLLDISNDVLVMSHYLSNLLKCIRSDPQIAMVVPTTPGVAGGQCITSQMLTPEQGEVFARRNNLSDPARWESRKLLYTPIALYNSKVILTSKGVGFWDKYFVHLYGGDDALSKRLISSGYKIILAKDCYCYHFGKVTTGGNLYHKENLSLLERRFS